MTLTALLKDGELRFVLDPGSEDMTGWEIVPFPDEIDIDRAIWNGTKIVERPLPVPTVVTPLQMRKAIRAAGLKPTVDAFIASLDDDEITEAWEYATQINRNDPFIALALTGLGWSDEQADELFILAASV